MSRSDRIVWKIYFVLFSVYTVSEWLNLITAGSDISVYYHIFLPFNPDYVWPYYFNLGSTFLNVLSLFPLLLFVMGQKRFWPFVWQFLLVLRIPFELAGHNYEWQMIASHSHYHPSFVAKVITFWLLFNIPSYAAHFKYAFGRRGE